MVTWQFHRGDLRVENVYSVYRLLWTNWVLFEHGSPMLFVWLPICLLSYVHAQPANPHFLSESHFDYLLRSMPTIRITLYKLRRQYQVFDIFRHSIRNLSVNLGFSPLIYFWNVKRLKKYYYFS